MSAADAPASGVDLAGLYVHVPFCSAICPYCDFAVTTGNARLRAGYVDSLLAELDAWSADARERFGAFDTLYFGGGTPSALEPALLSRVIDACRERFDLPSDAWLSLEANPEDVDAASAASWRALGVRTVSLGAQSFDDASLRRLGRRHDGRRARESVAIALEAGFETVSVDLILGLPGQTLESWCRDLATAIALEPHHVSCYQLTIHESTPFARQRAAGRLEELAEEAQADLYARTHEDLAAAGFAAYEVSNFARGAEHRSAHNSKYWRHAPYLGLGMSSHSFDGRRRWWNERAIGPYRDRVAAGELPIAGAETLNDAQLALECVMLRLRTAEGLPLRCFHERFGVDLLGRNRAAIELLVAGGRAVLDESSLRLLPPGLAIVDAIVRGLQVDPGYGDGGAGPKGR